MEKCFNPLSPRTAIYMILENNLYSSHWPVYAAQFNVFSMSQSLSCQVTIIHGAISVIGLIKKKWIQENESPQKTLAQ